MHNQNIMDRKQSMIAPLSTRLSRLLGSIHLNFQLNNLLKVKICTRLDIRILLNLVPNIIVLKIPENSQIVQVLLITRKSKHL
jgi:hypothetical protein